MRAQLVAGPPLRSWVPLLMGVLSGACGREQLDAVSGAPCTEDPEQAACALPSWPNQYSTANSDAWLAAHHDGLREIRPRVLVLDYHNEQTLQQVRGVAQRQIDALAEGSRYHGYADSGAQPFVRYELLDVIDLTDKTPPRDWALPSSTRVPLNADKEFDMPALFGEQYADVYGFRDDTGAALPLCALFERGLINELWLAVGDESRGREPPSMVECKARYAADNRRRADHSLVGSANGETCASLPVCGTTVRIAHLSPVRGVGCDLQVRGWAIGGSVRAIPYLADNARDFLAECGDSQYPPNATFMWDFENRTEVHAHCAHYGLRDGTDGNDVRETYSFDTVAALASRFPDCGGGWQIYWRQSMPGLDNDAFARDGSAMKNWWPFLFY